MALPKAMHADQISRSMFGIACGFHEAANRCLPLADLPELDPPPIIVNLAYACELYLKTLLHLEQKSGQGHMLDRLFTALSPDARSTITRRYMADLPAGTGRFSEALHEINHAYADWRSLEKAQRSTPAMNALWRLARILAALIVETCPDLSSEVSDIGRLSTAPGM